MSKAKIRSACIAVLIAAVAVCAALFLSVAPVSAQAEDGGERTIESATYAKHQVISYGKLLADELDTGVEIKYSDGETADGEIEWRDITAHTGVNVNFTTVTVTGVIKDTDYEVSRAVTTMPDDLVYFINCGSLTTPGKYDKEDFPDGDPTIGYNQTVFDYYKAKGSTLINDGVADQMRADSWGCYKGNGNDSKFTWSVLETVTFPYNTLRWSERDGGPTDWGYLLTDMQANESYRVFVGSISDWHPRTVNITFNGSAVAGSETLRIDSKKSFAVYENVKADSDGKIDILMKGANTNEPCISFIALQKMSTPYSLSAPSALSAAPVIGVEDTSVTFTSGIQAGAKLQIYNAAIPYKVLYEEAVDEEKIVNGEYTVDWGTPFAGVSQLCAVQINDGGASEVCAISITDIQDFEVTLTPDGYTTGSVTVTVSAHANSGIKSWSYQSGEFGEKMIHELDLPREIRESFTVTENGDYIVELASGLGVTYSETVHVGYIDPDRPTINVIPSTNGWGKGSYNVKITVTGTAPVVSFAMYKNGVMLAGSASVPSALSLSEEGEYTLSVTNAAGVTAMRTVNVSSRATTATVTKRYVNRTLTYSFTDNDDYTVDSISAYEVNANGVNRMTVSSGNRLDVYNPGTYVITVTATNGTTEMFAVVADRSDFSSEPEGIQRGTTLGVGLGVGLGGAVIAAAAVVTVLLVTKKKKAA